MFNADVCPGWLVRQPLVEDATKAYQALKSGIFNEYCTGQENALLEAAMILGQAFNAWESEQMKKAAKRG